MPSCRLVWPTTLFLMLCFTQSAHAQSDFDGDFWITKTQAIKLTYVVGFVDGRSHGINDAAEAVGTNLQDPRISRLASQVTVGQIGPCEPTDFPDRSGILPLLQVTQCIIRCLAGPFLLQAGKLSILKPDSHASKSY